MIYKCLLLQTANVSNKCLTYLGYDANCCFIKERTSQILSDYNFAESGKEFFAFLWSQIVKFEARNSSHSNCRIVKFEGMNSSRWYEVEVWSLRQWILHADMKSKCEVWGNEFFTLIWSRNVKFAGMNSSRSNEVEMWSFLSIFCTTASGLEVNFPSICCSSQHFIQPKKNKNR